MDAQWHLICDKVVKTGSDLTLVMSVRNVTVNVDSLQVDIGHMD